MSAVEQVSPSFNILGRLSRRNITNTSIDPDSMEPGQEVVAGPVNTTSRMFLFKPAPVFKRLKSQLGKRGRELKGKGKAEELPPLHTFENSAKPPAMEPIPQSTEMSDGTVSPSQNIPSRDCGDDSQNTPFRGCDEIAENDGSSLKEPVDNEKSDPSFVDVSRSMSTASLARRIHSLLSPFPLSYTLTSSGHFLCPGTSNHASAAESESADSTFLSLLSSASVMNGSISKGRESVWAALERLRYSPHPHPKEEPRETGESINATVSNELDAGVAEDVEMASVMICGPLHPTEDTEVEIARSEVVSINLEETSHEARPSLPSDEQGVGVSGFFFGKQKWKGSDKAPEAIPLAEKALPPPPPKIKEVRVWYPSRTKVSLQAFWWGYRIYLPPPVMRVLSDKSLEAAKRAAMITAALTWLVSHFPTGMVPPPMRAVVGVIKQIVPIMGYVGGFIAWSWNTIQGFDKGQGVTLSATWLLPIALIPGTWFYVSPPGSPSHGNSSET